MKKLICLIFALLWILTSAGNCEYDVNDMNFEELIELRDSINIRLQSLYPDYDYILSAGDYFVGMDIPEGKVMLYRLNYENDKYDILYLYDDNDVEAMFDGLTDEHPRLKCELNNESRLQVKRGPIGLKYLDD